LPKNKTISQLKVKLHPDHPGVFLRDVLSKFNLTVVDAAISLRVSRQMISRILCQQSCISPSMALRLNKLFGIDSRKWLDMQCDYDIWHTERKLKNEIKRIPTLSTSNPLKL
jgi:addiction module HigA family antidote